MLQGLLHLCRTSYHSLESCIMPAKLSKVVEFSLEIELPVEEPDHFIHLNTEAISDIEQ